MKYLDLLVSKNDKFSSIKKDIENATNVIVDCYKKGGKLMICGNGGSASDSAHITGELMKSFNKKRTLDKNFIDSLKNIVKDEKEYNLYIENLEKGLPTIDITAFTSLNTAYANDKNPELMYANAVLGLSKSEDVLLVISTSGNSKNVVHAANVAKAKGIKTIVLTGNTGGKIKDMVDICILSSEKETYLIQEDHEKIYHTMCLDIEDIMF